MSDHDQSRAPGHRHEPRASAAGARRAESPGKRTRAMSVASRSGAAPVQLKRDARPVQRSEDTDRWTDTLMRPDLYPAPVQRAASGAPSARELPEDGGGERMPEAVQAKMEGAFGTDFSAVRIYQGARSEALGATAYTQGTDIHFAPGQYQPSTESGQSLLGHELAHVVQQSQGRVSATTQMRGVGVNDDTALEREADDMGARAARGETAGGPSVPTSKQSAVQAKAAGTPVQLAVVQRDTSQRAVVQRETNKDNKDTANKIGSLPKDGVVQVVSLHGSASGKPAVGDYCQLKSDADFYDGPVGDASYKVKASGGRVGYVAASAVVLAQGIIGTTIFNQGKTAGSVNDSEINCLGHASRQGRAVTVGTNALSSTLAGLGYACTEGDHKTLATAIAQGKTVMMVYLYLYKSSWRDGPDQALTYAELKKKYSWTNGSWKDEYVLFDKAGKSLPIDYHALTYNQSDGKWEWVGHRKPKKSSGGYDLDSKPGHKAVNNPDLYFSSAQILSSIACVKQ